MSTDSYVLVKSALDKCHKHCFKNKLEITASTVCHCFQCKEQFSPSDIRKWADKGETAICPKCGVDSVIGDASGYDMTPALLHAMHEFWFERGVLPKDFDYSWFEPVKTET